MEINKVLSQHRKEISLLFVSCVICFLLLILRIVYSGSGKYIFLVWNLFLAGIPLLISYFGLSRFNNKKRRMLLLCTICLWMLFFPNAPYILTDLFHLHYPSDVPKWYDLVLVLSFAWTGLLFGFISLWNIERLCQNYISIKIIPYISASILFISSYGVYIGRYLRWNSWDIVVEPLELFNHISEQLFHPFNYPQAWGMTLFLGLLLNLYYWSFKYVHPKHKILNKT
ncbi:MAG: DUF1361 domain-containing protein [Bacteroidales bacterium]|nr:DUF1361 domain-containing protein [Bacteroidales bacterium]